MKSRSSVLIVGAVAALVAGWLLWPGAEQPAAPSVAVSSDTLSSTNASIAEDRGSLSAAATNRLVLRLSNTPDSETPAGYAALSQRPHAVLLENAALDTDKKFDLTIPAHLQAKGDPGAYVVQARKTIDSAFHTALRTAGAKEVSYIPNNAWLVQMTAAQAASLKNDPLVQTVLPYQPYYKVQASLLGRAVAEEPLLIGQALTVGLFNDSAAETLTQIEKMGAVILSLDRSPFGPLVRVTPPLDWTALARLPGVMRLEPATRRVAANDLSRALLGVAANSVVQSNYMNLTGSNVMVEVNDTGVDPTHPDLVGRVFADSFGSTYDTSGHGTHVAGIIAGDGTKSITVTNARGSVTPTATNQFRGKAPLAKIFSVGGIPGGHGTNVYVRGTNFFIPGADIYLRNLVNGQTNIFNPGKYPDWYLQEAPAVTNALISNNSWVNENANEYDLSAASFDAATRDALPEFTGPQPVLFVFPAGNGGGGNAVGQNGNADSIISPGTAKNVVTVGALEQFRNITNEVTALGTTNPVPIWTSGSDSSSQVASYSSRGNVGILTEGPFGRFKPDVIAPGSWVLSTRPTMWDTNAYYNVTNNHSLFYPGQVAYTNTMTRGVLAVPQNAIGVKIIITGSGGKNLPIYVSRTGFPTTNTFDIKRDNQVLIPPDSGGTITGIGSILNRQIRFAVNAGTNNSSVVYDIETQVITTNDLGNQLEILQRLNDSMGTPPHFYFFETGTSYAAPAVSGTLALIQDFFTNTLKLTPSPALLKALLINGARVTGGYKFAVTNTINYQGWGVPNLPNSIPAAMTNGTPPPTRPLFFIDQSPTNALATGDRRNYLLEVPTAGARAQAVRVTLAWTDPPGNPAASIKLVNDLDLVVTNLGTGEVYYGNNFSSAGDPPFSVVVSSNSLPDNVNNVENVYLPPLLGTNYAIAVIGKAVNVNAVTLEQTNIVQDFALVVSTGDGNNTNGVTLTTGTPGLAQTLSPQYTPWLPTNTVVFNQYAGANAPWLSTNTVLVGTNNLVSAGATLFIGQTNQWHFYIITNTFAVTNANFTNAGFITFLPATLALPREGGYFSDTQNPTRPQGDLEMYVATGGSALLMTNLDVTVLSNCLRRVNGNAASLTRGGTEFVTYSDSVANQVYVVGIKCEDQMAGQYAFAAIFSDKPFSSPSANGQTVNGMLVPAIIPDGNNAHPGVSYSIGIATLPMKIRRVTMTNFITHQNFGDLVGGLSHNDKNSLINNHTGLGFVVNTNLIYDDSGEMPTNAVPPVRHTDAPGSLVNFEGEEASGVWVFNEVDNNLTQTGRVENFTLEIYRKNDDGTFRFDIAPGQWGYDYIDVPGGATNLLIIATNTPPFVSAPLQLYLNPGTRPTFTNYVAKTELTNTVAFPPGNSGSISYGPPLAEGRYYFGVFNADSIPHTVTGRAFYSLDENTLFIADYFSGGPVILRDDALTVDTIRVTNAESIQNFNVGLRVDHPRISDLVFHLISPDGTRYLLMENRGAQSTNGCGVTLVATNFVNVGANGGPAAATNQVNTFQTAGTIPLTYDMFFVPDQITVYYGQSTAAANLITNLFVSGGGTLQIKYPPVGVTPNSTYLTIVMNATNHPSATRWVYNVGGVTTNNYYLAFTEDTNFTTTPIKFAPPPFLPFTNLSTVFTDSFETYPLGTNSGPVLGPWNLAGDAIIATNPPAYDLANWLTLPTTGVLSTTLATVGGQKYQLTYAQGTLPYQRFYVANAGTGSGDGSVQTFDTNGTTILFSATNSAPDAVAVDANGNVFVADAGVFPINGSISRFTPGGQHSVFVPTGAGLIYPDGLAFDISGNLYVADSGAFGPTDGFIMRFTPAGVGTLIASNLNNPVGLAFDANNNLYVAELLDNDVLKIPPGGTPTVFATNLNNPYGLAFDPNGNLYIANSGSSDISVVGSGGGAASVFVVMPNPPLALVFDEQTNLYASDIISDIYQITPAATFNLIANSGGPNPQGLAYFNSDIEHSGLLNWVAQSSVFTPTTSGTTLALDGGANQVLRDGSPIGTFNDKSTFDAFVVSQLPSHLYYQPEHSFGDLLNTSAFGNWQLEVLDTRASGAFTNGAQVVSWRLEFTFANTNLAPAFLGAFNGLNNNTPIANQLIAGGGYFGYYTVTVPPNATIATNYLQPSASLPVNVWFTTNNPTTLTNASGTLLLAGATAGTTNLTTSTFPPITAGGVYYLLVENTNAAPVTFAMKVAFDDPSGASRPQFSGISRTANKAALSWRTSRGARYKVQWSDTFPPVWHTLTSPVLATTNGVSTFIDTGAQTAPLGPQRYYRLVQVP